MPARKQVVRVFPQEIPDKIYYSISEVSEYTQTEPHVLRYWETKFSKLNPKRVGGNQRKYTRSDLDMLFVILYLLHQEGYTLDGAEKKLSEPEVFDQLRRRYGINGTGRAANDSEAKSEPKPDPVTPRASRGASVVVEKKLLRELRRGVNDLLKMLK